MASLISPSTDSIVVKSSWDFFVHYSDNKNWDLDSYIHVIRINNLSQAILFEEQLSNKMIQNCMIFVMKNGINPTWEDPEILKEDVSHIKLTTKYYIKYFA